MFAAARTSTQRFPWHHNTYEALTSLHLTHCGLSATGQIDCLRINIPLRENVQDNGTFTKRKYFVNNPHQDRPSRPVTKAVESDASDENDAKPEKPEADAEPLPYWVEPEA